MGFYLNKQVTVGLVRLKTNWYNMAPERIETSITIFGSPPWGFRISGGKEFNQPLVVSRVTPGSLASKGGIAAGDVVLAIDGEYVSGLTQSEFEAKLSKATGSVMLVIEKNGATVSQDGVVKSRNAGTASSLGGSLKNSKHRQAVQGAMNVQGGERWTIDADNVNNRSFGLPAFFAAASMVREGTVPPHLRVQMEGPGKSTVVHAQYNTPMGMYSDDNILDSVQAQAYSMGISFPGAENYYSGDGIDPDSAVYREVHRQNRAKKPNQTQSRSFKILSSMVDREAA